MARIVVIDDAEDFTALIIEILEAEGHAVVSCGSEAAALPCILREQPDLVLLDLRLGGNSEGGWAILDALRKDPRTASIPVIVTSAALDELQSHAAWLEQHGILTLPKPFNLDDLLALVDAVSGPDATFPAGLGA